FFPLLDSKLLSVGEHTFNFRYRLPQNIPPSYESQWGFVRHYAEAVLETQSLLKPNFKCSEMITVVSTGLDLRKYPDSVKPEVVNLEKDVKQLNGSAGKLEVTVWINKTAFVPGENVIVNTIINNNTSKQLLSAKATIIEAKIYKVASRNFTKPTIISSKVKKYLSTTTSFNWINENLLVPEVHLTRLKGCSLIDLRYSFHFEVILKTPAQLPELQTYIPILLGTVPLKSTENIGGEIKIKQSYNAPLTTTPYTLEPPKVTIQMGHNQASNAPLTPTPYPLEPSKVTTQMVHSQVSNAPLTPPPYTLEPPNVTPLFGFNGLDQMGQNQGMASVPVCNTVGSGA
ncbi:Arrestin domain-containing protein 1, partial [Armadillidium vulgare]